MNFNNYIVVLGSQVTETGFVITNNPRITEKITLYKETHLSETGEKYIYATIARSFYSVGNPDLMVGQLLQDLKCSDCYLSEMGDGDCLPVVSQGRDHRQIFSLFDGDGYEVFRTKEVSYHMAKKLSERQTTFLGRIRNRLTQAWLEA